MLGEGMTRKGECFWSSRMKADAIFGVRQQKNPPSVQMTENLHQEIRGKGNQKIGGKTQSTRKEKERITFLVGKGK